MGNSFICSPTEYFKCIKSNICFQSQYIENKEDQLIINLNIDKNIYQKSINQIKDYFNKSGNEIMGDFHKKEKAKKHLNKKKHINALNRLSDNKYELMLKRLLEQKKEKRKGPKRRETIRKNNDLKVKLLINEVLLENINIVKNKGIIIEQDNDLLIKNINYKNFRYSASFDKKFILSNNLNKNSVKNKYNLQLRNTINEIINESSGCSVGYCKKQTRQSSSPKNKKNE